ncbi:MAG: acyl-CoA reductase [Bacteroidota bacterium]
MADRERRLEAFVKLGKFLRDYCEYSKKQQSNAPENAQFQELEQHIGLAGRANGWFTSENIEYALRQWGNLLHRENLQNWLSGYPLKNSRQKTVAIVMAGNIPLVGFHDFLAVLLSGNSVLAKLSSNDTILLPFLARYLISIEPSLKSAIVFTEDALSAYDVVIATGSNNTARYFSHYFGHKPHIIRRNRNSVGILTGKESSSRLEALGEDIFRYYGLGCRSISKIFVPKGYDFDRLFKAIFPYRDILEHEKYANNYDYNKAVYLMSEFKILDNGFLMLKEDENYASPIATLFYETYSSLETVRQRIKADQENIQCVVADGILDGEIIFGQTQNPSLTDYADGIDTVDFLLKT